MVDKEKIAAGVKLLLEGIGEDLEREGLKETPDRIARMYTEICGGMYEDAGKHLRLRQEVDARSAQSSNRVVDQTVVTVQEQQKHGAQNNS